MMHIMYGLLSCINKICGILQVGHIISMQFLGPWSLQSKLEDVMQTHEYKTI